MIVSTGRSTLNPYIAVVIGLLALALYVSTTGKTVPKLMTQAEAKASQEFAASSPTPAPTPPSSVAAAPSIAAPSVSSPFASSVSPLSEPTANPFASPPQRSPLTMPPAREMTPEPTPATPSPFGPQSGGQQEEEGWLDAAPAADGTGAENRSGEGLFGSMESGAAATAATVGATAAAVADEASLGGSIVWTLLSIIIGVVVFFGLLAVLSRLGGVDISAALQRGLNTSTSLYDVTLSQPEATPLAPVAPPQPATEHPESEVFQVGNGNLTYVEAKAACRAQGAKLATYSQIEDAYNNGAEWCSYGWSDGQLALFPTQKGTYEQLQAGCTGDQNACGRPGINGGFIANPKVQFAANCYGVKPKPTKAEKRALNAPAALSPQDSEANRLAQLFKQADKHFQVRPFAPGEWTEPGIAPKAAEQAASAYNSVDSDAKRLGQMFEHGTAAARSSVVSDAKRLDRMYRQTDKSL